MDEIKLILDYEDTGFCRKVYKVLGSKKRYLQETPGGRWLTAEGPEHEPGWPIKEEVYKKFKIVYNPEPITKKNSVIVKVNINQGDEKTFEYILIKESDSNSIESLADDFTEEWENKNYDGTFYDFLKEKEFIFEQFKEALEIYI